MVILSTSKFWLPNLNMWKLLFFFLMLSYSYRCKRHGQASRKMLAFDQNVRKDSFTGLHCGTQGAYIVTTETCCNGTIQQLLYGSRTKCCGSTIYDSQNTKCCQPGNITIQISLNCSNCGLVQYDPKKSLCCSVTLHERGANIRCCGSVAYNNTVKKCCPGNILTPMNDSCQRCGTIPFDQRTKVCCARTLYLRRDSSRCCGSAVYDSRRQKCCLAGNLIIPSSVACPSCKGTAFNPRKRICCSSVLHQRTFGTNTRCCGSNVYNNSVSTCCLGNKKIPKGIPCQYCNGIAFNPTIFICCEGALLRPLDHGVFTKCCGAKTFDRRIFRCCSGKITAMDRQCIPVCRGKRFKPKTFICCNEVIHFRVYGDDTQCCGQKIFNSKSKKCCLESFIVPETVNCNRRTPITCGGSTLIPGTHICCESSVRHLKAFDSFTACCGVNRTYNTATHSCCPGLNIVVPKGFSCIPCGGRHINLQTHRCCRGQKVHPLRYGKFTACCGSNRTFDQRINKCCPDKRVSLKAKPCLGLCGDLHYDITNSICCAGRVVYNALYGLNTKCCGNSGVFDQRFQKCCFGYRIIPKTAQCVPCGNFYFNPAKHICCNRMHTYFRKHGSFSSCCGKFIFHKKNQRCCDGHAVVPANSSCISFQCGPHNNIQPGKTNNKWFFPKYGIHSGCCSFNSQYRVYDKRTQKCCNGKPIPILQNCTSSCGPINRTKHLCCSGRKVLKLYGSDTKCCDITAYHPLIQLCCEGTPGIRFGGRAARCCGQRSYDSGISKCCTGNRLVTKGVTCP